jgi:hypothetical protein
MRNTSLREGQLYRVNTFPFLPQGSRSVFHTSTALQLTKTRVSRQNTAIYTQQWTECRDLAVAVGGTCSKNCYDWFISLTLMWEGTHVVSL